MEEITTFTAHMVRMWALALAAGMIFQGCGLSVSGQDFHLLWEDRFSESEKKKVGSWLAEVTGSVRSTLGPYPFDMYLHIHRRDEAPEPVPWANTLRSGSHQGVDFFIDPAYPLEAFLADWTAPHEISHLSLPYLGRNHAWFAEGYASFMQYQVMEELKILSESEVAARYARKMAIARRGYGEEEDFVTVSRKLQSQHRYPEMYWGGASYFIRADQVLRDQHGIRLTQLVRRYQECCRLEDRTIDEVVRSLDRLLGSNLFSVMLEAYETTPANVIIRDYF